MPRASYIVLVPILLAAACCFGSRAREQALLPVLRDTWARVRADVEAGEPKPAAADVLALDAALASGEVSEVRAVLPTWEKLSAGADAGYSVRGIDSGVAASLRERLVQFKAGLVEYAGGGGGS